MRKFDRVSGTAIPWGAKNVDTDLILPAKYLKVVTRTGLGVHAFETLRQQADNLFDAPRHHGAPILIAGDNFGCGSSREHAPWALADMGLRVIIAPSFADIFAGNAFKNGILLIDLPQSTVDLLLDVAASEELTVDLPDQSVSSPNAGLIRFEVDSFRKSCLIEGLDEIGLTSRMAEEIDRFEESVAARCPWIADAARHAA